MPKKKAVGVPDLDAYLGKNRRTLCSYEEGAKMYGLRFYSFVNLAKEANANIKVKRHALVDLDVLDAYIDKLGEEEMARREESREMHTRNKTDKLEQLKNQRKKFVRYEEGAELYSMGVNTFRQLAKEAGAVYKIKNIALVNLDVIEDYLEAFKEEQ